MIAGLGSGKLGLEGRPGLTAALARAARLKCRVIVSKLDRPSGTCRSSWPSWTPTWTRSCCTCSLHWAKKERQLISQRTQDALAPMVGTGQLSSKTNLTEAQAKGCVGNAATFTGVASRVMPLVGRFKVGTCR